MIILCSKSYEIRGSDGRIYIDRAAQRRDGIVPTLDGNPIDLATEEEEERYEVHYSCF